MENVAQHVTKDTTIGDVVNKFPNAAVILSQKGLHCVGCHVNPYETIEQGSMGHGMTDEQISEMVNEVNEFIEKNGAAKPVEKVDVTNADIMVTEAAASKIKEFLEKQGDKYTGLRISVQPGGCSGMTYGMDFEESAKEDDMVFEKHGVKIFVDKPSMEKLSGANVDYVEGLQGAGFKIDNPNTSSSCGCGKSFN